MVGINCGRIPSVARGEISSTSIPGFETFKEVDSTSVTTLAGKGPLWDEQFSWLAKAGKGNGTVKGTGATAIADAVEESAVISVGAEVASAVAGESLELHVHKESSTEHEHDSALEAVQAIEALSWSTGVKDRSAEWFVGISTRMVNQGTDSRVQRCAASKEHCPQGLQTASRAHFVAFKN